MSPHDKLCQDCLEFLEQCFDELCIENDHHTVPGEQCSVCALDTLQTVTLTHAVENIQESYRLAMKGAGLTPEVIHDIEMTVEDAIVNNIEKLCREVENNENTDFSD